MQIGSVDADGVGGANSATEPAWAQEEDASWSWHEINAMGNYGGGWYNKGKPWGKEEKAKEIGKEKEKERKERRKEEKEKERKEKEKEKEKEKGQKADASIVEAHITLGIAPKRAKEKVSSTLLMEW